MYNQQGGEGQVTQTVKSNFQLSFEFFPPKTEIGLNKLGQTAKQCSVLGPEYFSITFGAAGSEQTKTLETCQLLQQVCQLPVAPHITCIGQTKQQIKNLLQIYQSNHIKHLVVLRGDHPSRTQLQSDFKYATELVQFIRNVSGDYFYIDVAAYPEVHPQSKNAATDMIYFKDKIDAGANGAITQYFYNLDAYEDFVERAQKLGIDIPITAGIMPIYNFVQLQRFSDSCGAELPRWIRKKIELLQDDEASLLAFGIDFVSELCNKLIQSKVPGLHFYTLNRADAVLEIYKQLEIPRPQYAKKPFFS